MPIPAFLLTPLGIKIIVGIVLALGVTVWWNVHNYRIRQQAIAEYKVKLQVCNDATTTAVNANKSLQSSVDRLAEKVRQQNAQIGALAAEGDKAVAVRDARLAQANAKAKALQAEADRLRAIAASTPLVLTDQNCKEVTDEAARLLRGAADAGSVR